MEKKVEKLNGKIIFEKIKSKKINEEIKQKIESKN